MSLAIDVEKVTGVLLTDGEWYTVEGGSFNLDVYEFMGQAIAGVCPSGFTFREPGGKVMSGPLTSVVAVRSGKATAKVQQGHVSL